jgi:hypothetical protein
MSRINDEMSQLLREYNGDVEAVNYELTRRQKVSQGLVDDEDIRGESQEDEEELNKFEGFRPCVTTAPSFMISAQFTATPKELDEEEENCKYKQEFTDHFISKIVGNTQKTRRAVYLIGATVVAARNDFGYPINFNTEGLYANNPCISNNGKFGDVKVDPTSGEVPVNYPLTSIPEDAKTALFSDHEVPYIHTVRDEEIGPSCIHPSYNQKLLPNDVPIDANHYCAEAARNILNREGSGETTKGFEGDASVWITADLFDQVIREAKRPIKRNEEDFKLVDFNKIGFSIQRGDAESNFCAPSDDFHSDNLINVGSVSDYFVNSNISPQEKKNTAYIKIQANLCVKSFSDDDNENY